MTLAINGGTPIREKAFPAYKVIGDEEKALVNEVLDSGILSKYLGCWHDDFYGGPQIQSLEKEWASYFGVKHAIAVNSCTSGLYAAVGAIGIEPEDEVIVSPYTMSASATAALIFNAVPVFADIEEEYFCLDPDSIESRITSKTKAIIVVDIFGLPYDVEKINAIAKKYNLKVIEDCAQAPGAMYKNKFAGTLGDVGVYSLNYHKHIHAGEGGIVVTDDDEIADRVRLISNHAEAVVGSKGNKNISNMIGFNFRLTEMQAAIARCQLKKLPKLLKDRQDNCQYLNDKLSKIDCITPTPIRPECTHSYYVHPLLFNEKVAGVKRDIFIEAVAAELPLTSLREKEGKLLCGGYVKPLYLEPMYQQKIAYGSKGYPFNTGRIDYSEGHCPVVEKLNKENIFIHEMMRPPMTKNDLDDVVKAFEKVWGGVKDLSIL